MLLSFFTNGSADLAIWSFYFMQRGGLTLTDAVTLYTLVFLVLGLTDLPTGSLADRFGRKRVYSFSLLCRALGALTTASFPTLYGLICGCALTGLGWALLSGCLEALVFDNLRAEGEESEYGGVISDTVTAQFVARAFVLCASGFLFDYDAVLPYLVLACSMGAALFVLMGITEHPYPKSIESGIVEQVRGSISFLLGEPKIVHLIIVSASIGVATNQLWILFQPILSAKGLAPAAIGVGYAFGALGSALGSRLSKFFIVRRREELVYVTQCVFVSIGATLLVFGDGNIAAYCALATVSVAFGSTWSAFNSLANPMLPSSRRATCLSIVSTVNTLLIGVAGRFAGIVFERFGAALIPIATAATVCVLLPFAMRAVTGMKALQRKKSEALINHVGDC